MRYCKLNIFFCLLKIIFQNSEIFYDKMLVRSNFFSHFVEKIENFKLRLSKQHNEILKMRSEMQKTRKESKIIKLGNIFREKNAKNFPNPGNPENFRYSRKFF